MFRKRVTRGTVELDLKRRYVPRPSKTLFQPIQSGDDARAGHQSPAAEISDIDRRFYTT